MAPLNSNPAQSTDDNTGADGVPARTRTRSRHRLSAPGPRVAYSLGIATVCVLAAFDLLAGRPTPATAETQTASVVVADALGVDGSGIEAPAPEDSELLGQLAASRSERDAEQAAAAESQAQAEEAAAAAKAEEEARLAAEAAAAAAAAEAAAKAEAEAAEAEEAAAAAQAPAPASASPSAPAARAGSAATSTAASVVAKITNNAGPIKGVAQAAANAVVSNVPGAAGITIGGTRASAADPGGHPSGLALDFMCTGALGDAIAQYHIAHWDELGVDYIIWEQRMLSSPGGAWKAMADRGSATANHYDHVHVNYRG